MKIEVLFFATLKGLAGEDRSSLQLESGATVRDLRTALEQRYSALAPALASALIAVNREFAFPDHILQDGDEVAIFPPVSGGQAPPTFFWITDQALDLNTLMDRIVTPRTGATCLFTGVVRAKTEGDQPHSTAYLEYEAYVPMAEAKMQQVADEIRARWELVEGIAIVQRIGRLDPGTPTVLIACSAGHRDSGVFEAARYGIDRLKEIVPIWKKEIGPEGAFWVEGSYQPGPQDVQIDPES